MVVSIVIAIVFIVGIFAIGGGGRGSQPTPSEIDQTPIAQVGDYPITIGRLTSAVREGVQTRVQQGMEPSAVLEAQLLAEELYFDVHRGLQLQLARERGLRVTDELILREIENDMERQIEQARFQMIINGQLKPDSSEKDFQDAFQKQAGVDTATYKKRQLDAAREVLKDEQRRAILAASAVPAALIESYTKKLNPTDDEVKKSLATLQVQKIVLKDRGTKDPMERAKEILAEIKGGLSFDTAINRYSEAEVFSPNQQKTSSEPLSMATVLADPTYSSLKNAKVGDVSEPIRTRDGVTIYKVTEIKNDQAKDFDKNKQMHREAYVRTLANLQVANDLQEMGKSNVVKWESEGYRLLYAWAALSRDQNQPPKDELIRQYENIAKQAEAVAAKEDPLGGQQQAALAQYLAVDSIWQLLSREEREARREERVESIRKALEHGESLELLLELADLLADMKSKEAADVLLRAAKNNFDLGNFGQSTKLRIGGMITKLQTSGLLTSEQLTALIGEQERWQKEFEEQKKQDEADRKAIEDARKAEEAAAKAAEPEVKPVERDKPGVNNR